MNARFEAEVINVIHARLKMPLAIASRAFPEVTDPGHKVIMGMLLLLIVESVAARVPMTEERIQELRDILHQWGQSN